MGDFQNIFKRLRNSCGLTQAEMAEKLGISSGVILDFHNPLEPVLSNFVQENICPKCHCAASLL